jgi:sugar phosphate isomerase/epimerase
MPNVSQSDHADRTTNSAFDSTIKRRDFLKATAVAAAVGSTQLNLVQAAMAPGFQLKYLVSSSMYGYTKLAEILPEVAKTGSTAIDIWPKVHGDQREQLDEMGEEKFAALLKENNVTLGCITQYKLGPFGLLNEMRLAQRLGCTTIVTGGKGPSKLNGQELKAAVQDFLEQLKPHLAVAEETGVTIAVENHANNLIDSLDSIKWLMEFSPSKNLGIALAPYHLPQEEAVISKLIHDLGNHIKVFYAWEHGMGSQTKLPKEQELMQMPGRGKLDYHPIMAALKDIQYTGWTSIFMHPYPRGLAIHDTTAKVTEEINHSRTYLAECLGQK